MYYEEESYKEDIDEEFEQQWIYRTLYHIVVSTEDLDEIGLLYRYPEDLYGPEFSVHLFSPKKLNPAEAILLASKILDEKFPKWRDYHNLSSLKYVYYEKLKIPETPESLHEKVFVSNEPYYTVINYNLSYDDVHEGKAIIYVSNLPDKLADKIRNLRKRQITVVYPYTSPIVYDHIVDAREKAYKLKKAIEMFGDKGELFKDSRGYHFIANLRDTEVELNELVDMRLSLGDSNARHALDEAYLDYGLDYLVNSFYAEYCVFGESNVCEKLRYADPRVFIEEASAVESKIPEHIIDYIHEGLDQVKKKVKLKY